MRTYLVVVDETKEAEVALRFATRRAAKTGGAVQILVIVPPQDFVAWGGIQATIESEMMESANALVERALTTLDQELALRPAFTVKQGNAVQVIHETLAHNPDIAALVLGAAAVGSPGPLVAHFAGADSGRLPCPVMIIPGSLSSQTLDRLS